MSKLKLVINNIINNNKTGPTQKHQAGKISQT